MATLVGLMIASGLARHEKNQRTARAGPGRSVEIVRGFVADAARFLESTQEPDGAWSYGRSRSPAMETADRQPNLASTARILLAARGGGYEQHPFHRRGVAFVRAHQGRLLHWIADPVATGADGVEATADALALSVLLLGPDAASAEPTRALLRARVTRSGLYPHRLDAPTAPANEPVLGDNVALLAILPGLEMDAGPLLASVRRQHGGGMPEPSPSWPLVRYLASLAAESAPASARSLGWLLAAGPDLPGPIPEIDSLSLAAHLKVRAEECLRERDVCQDLNAVTGALVARRRFDGSWTPAPYARSGGEGPDAAPYFTGSGPETTAVALSGLAAYVRVLEGRAAGRLVSGEEKEALPPLRR